ncbi:apolipoprotein N-acyltransferase [Aliiglaciecola litoralis]|uniref:apolipoprotein N-acyltransferase n=1 Tax=Aliiglaciecola litoralis TaxID=582857 RepID=UPI0031DB144A
MTFSYAPFSLWLILPLAVSAFFVLLTHSSSPFKIGFAFGLGWFGAGISWVHVSIADFGGIPLAGSLTLMFLLCSYLALFPATFCWLLKRYMPVRNWLLAAPLLWFLIEWIRSWLFTGFPWLSLGYSQIDSPLAGWMPLIGETGVSALLIALSMSMALGVMRKNLTAPLIIAITTFVGGWVLSMQQWVSVSKQPISIAMVQGNIKQELRWAPEQQLPTMQKYQRMTDQHWHNHLIIWPEAAVPQLESTAESFLQNLDQKAAQADTGLITGIVNYNFNSRQAFNNLIVLGKRHIEDVEGHYSYLHANRYDKHHLLPFGEFVPFEDWLRKLGPIFDLPMSSFTRGNYLQANLIANGVSLAPAICFEIAFPRQIAANLTKDTDFIITVSNDAWFGGSHGPDQHLEIARARAKEFAVPVLRATNNGITAFIDHQGNIISRLPQFEAGVLSADISPTKGNTPYRLIGDGPLWLLTFAYVLFNLYRRFKPKTQT